MFLGSTAEFVSRAVTPVLGLNLNVFYVDRPSLTTSGNLRLPNAISRLVKNKTKQNKTFVFVYLFYVWPQG